VHHQRYATREQVQLQLPATVFAAQESLAWAFAQQWARQQPTA